MGVTGPAPGARLHVLVVEVPGSAALRIAAEATIAAAGHVLAGHPASADLLLVCGAPGPELAEAVDRVWDQMPRPRHRAGLTAPADVATTLRRAQDALADRRAQRSAADDELRAGADRRRPERGDRAHRDDADGASHGETTAHDHDASGHGHGPMPAHDHGHGSMSGNGHGHGHGSMSGPGGYPLAGGAEDRDGLEMDVLHRRLGPILPAWPAGLVVEVTLAGDVITAASARVVDTADRRSRARPAPAVIALDDAARLLAVAGWDAASARALRLRDLALAGDGEHARRPLRTLRRRVARSVVLRWSLRGLPVRAGVDVRAVLLTRLDRADAALRGARTEPEPTTALGDIPALMIGRDLGSARLVLAALTVDGSTGTDDSAGTGGGTDDRTGTTGRHRHG